MKYNTNYLIQLVREKETIPDSGVAYSEDVLLRYLDQSLKSIIVPVVEKTLEEYFVVTKDFNMPAQEQYPQGSPPTGVANVVNIPGAATGLRLRDVYVVGNDGTFYNLPRLTPTQAASQNYGSLNWSIPYNNQISSAGGFYLQGNQVQIFPYGLASNKIIRITFHRRPNTLCLVSDAAQVTNVSGDTLTVDTVQPNWIPGRTRVCVISNEEPHDFCVDLSDPNTVYTSYNPLDDVLLSNVVGNILTLPAGKGAGVAVGDWVCLTGQSVFAQNIPTEMIPALIQKAAEMCIHAAGDAEGYKIAKIETQEMLALAVGMITPRVEGKQIKLIPTNSIMRSSRYRGSFGVR